MSPIAWLIVVQLVFVAAFLAAAVLLCLGIVIGIGSRGTIAGEMADQSASVIAEEDPGQDRVAEFASPRRPRSRYQHGRARHSPVKHGRKRSASRSRTVC